MRQKSIMGFVGLVIVLFLSSGCRNTPANQPKTRTEAMSEKIVKTDEEWRKILTPEQYHIAREKGTERAFTGKYWNTKTPGTYKCVACGLDLFNSDHKYDSGTGWPSFWQPIAEKHIATQLDHSLMRERTEVLCARCDAHLGHVFEDGPHPTNLRYCINSAALNLVEREKTEK